MPLTKLQFKPGINRETTAYTNTGGWFDMDKVRFRAGFPEKIGGWEKDYTTFSFLGVCRDMHPWRSLIGELLIGVGTSLKYYINEGGAFNDITPLRTTSSAGDSTFAATNGSSTVRVNTSVAHGAVTNDFVIFSGAASLGGNITADVLNQEFQITRVTDNAFDISARTVSSISSITVDGELAPTLVAANSSDTGNGGGSTVTKYELSSGLDTTVLGTGWGAGPWSRGTWGSAHSSFVITDALRLWSADNFGEDLLFCPRNGNIYYWKRSTSTTTYQRAVELSSLSGAGATDGKAPTIARQVMVSDNDRHVIAFGCDPESNLGTQDPLLIRFSDQESLTEWNALPTNTAGELRIGSGSEIVQAVETRQQILVFTDSSLHAMQYLGPPFTFGLQMISEATTIRGPMAAVAVDDSVFWMGKNDFYVYSGGVQTLNCTVKDYVFNDFNHEQSHKVFGATNTAFSEIWWFYPSDGNLEIDRYVVFNYEQKIWFYGTMVRTAWIDRELDEYPMATGADGYLYTQEFGFNDGSTSPCTPITAYIESSPIDIADGNQFSFVRRLIPDLTFVNSLTIAAEPQATFTVQARNFPGQSWQTTDSDTVSKTASVPIEQYTNQVFLRLRGRSIAIKIESSQEDTTWRLGSPRLEIRPDGTR